MADRRNDAKHSRRRLPLGTIRLRSRERGGHHVRFIKYRTDGPNQAANWMPLARWWWLQNKGEIPPGYRVVHADGDTLNDDPTGANYELMTPGDVIGNWHFNNPDDSDRNYAKCRAATAEANRLRGQIRRAISWLPTRWYAVDFERRRIFNEPHPARWQAYAAHGAAIDGSVNGAGIAAAVLGWPDLRGAQAIVLACVLRVALSVAAIHVRAKQLAAPHGFSTPRRVHSWHQYIKPLRAAGLLDAIGVRGRRSFKATDEARRRRRQPITVVAVRGCELDGEGFKGFERVNGDDAARRSA